MNSKLFTRNFYFYLHITHTYLYQTFIKNILNFLTSFIYIQFKYKYFFQNSELAAFAKIQLFLFPRNSRLELPSVRRQSIACKPASGSSTCVFLCQVISIHSNGCVYILRLYYTHKRIYTHTLIYTLAYINTHTLSHRLSPYNYMYSCAGIGNVANSMCEHSAFYVCIVTIFINVFFFSYTGYGYANEFSTIMMSYFWTFKVG